MSKKPQGFNAVTEVTATGVGPALVEHQSLVLLAQKPAAEQAIMQMFAAILPKMPEGTAPLGLLDYQHKAENDLDFRINTPEGEFDLELTEFAPLEALRVRHRASITFKNAPNTHTVGDLADLLFDCVSAKNHRYGPDTTKKILLVYVAHFAFLPSETILALVRSKLDAVPHAYAQVLAGPLPLPG